MRKRGVWFVVRLLQFCVLYPWCMVSRSVARLLGDFFFQWCKGEAFETHKGIIGFHHSQTLGPTELAGSPQDDVFARSYGFLGALDPDPDANADIPNSSEAFAF